MPDPQPRLRIVPCSVTKAREFVGEIHRHHGPSTSALFAVAVADDAGLVRGVAMIGRPVARLNDDGWTLEVTRVATDGCENACSALYGAAKRAGKALGYSRLLTYTRADEPGSSPRGAGLTDDGPIRARSWNMPSRPRVDKTEIVQRRRWSFQIGGDPVPVEWPKFERDQDSLFDGAAA